MAKFDDIPTAYIRETEPYPSRSTFGISKILRSPTLPEIVVPSSTKSPQSPGTITYNTFSLLRAVLGIQLYGIYEENERSLVLCTEGVQERSADNRATLLAEWLLVGGGV